MPKKQSATYFTFAGGLNTQASDLNANPADARDLSNVFLTDSATVRRRPGMDFLPNLGAATIYWNDMQNYYAAASTFTDPAPAGVEFQHIMQDGSTLNVLVLHLGNYIVIYNRDSLSVMTTMTSPYQRIPLPNEYSSKAKHAKTRFAKDGNRVYLINPFMPLSFIAYDESISKFRYHTEPIYIRNLGGDAEPDARVTVGTKTFRACQSHSGDAATNKPPTGTQWEDFWVLEGAAPATGAPSAWGAGTRSVVRVAIDSYSDTAGDLDTEVTVYGYYYCKLNHTSSASTEPNVGVSWEAYWVKFDESTDSYNGPFFGSQRVRYTQWVTGTAYTAGTNNYASSVEPKKWIDAAGFPAGFSAGCMSQGRLWVANVPGEKNTIYFSQSVAEDKHYQRMYAFADPLNPDDPDVVATDGGRIRLTAADEIVGLADYIGGVLVLATNGIWYISGSDGYFKATEYNIKKVSDDGCMGRFSWTAVENNIMYGSVSGIYYTSLDDISGEPVVTEISVKIKDFWAGIPVAQRALAEFHYNPDTFSVYVAMNFETPNAFSIWNSFAQSSRKRDMLVFHTKLKAWYKYSLPADPDQDKVTIGGLIPVVVNLSDYEPVTVAAANVTTGGALVTTPSDKATASTITALVLMKRQGSSINWSLGHLNGSTFKDFSRSSTDSISNTAFIQSVPQLYSDGGHRKQVPYLYTFFETVETGFDTITSEYINPGGCLYRVVWNWSKNADAAKWGPAYAAYKPVRFNYIYEDGSLLAYSVVRNRHRIRGSGPAISFRFESDGDKDFHLLGWQAQLSVDEDV